MTYSLLLSPRWNSLRDVRGHTLSYIYPLYWTTLWSLNWPLVGNHYQDLFLSYTLIFLFSKTFSCLSGRLLLAACYWVSLLLTIFKESSLRIVTMLFCSLHKLCNKFRFVETCNVNYKVEQLTFTLLYITLVIYYAYDIIRIYVWQDKKRKL